MRTLGIAVLLLACGARTEIPSPGGATACAAHSGCFLLGGLEDDTFKTWRWDGVSWTNASPTSSPPARGMATTAVLDGSIVFFGGWGKQSGNDPNDLFKVYDDTWVWNGGCWTQQNPSHAPSARAWAAAATLDGVVLFGGQWLVGYAPEIVLADTWTWNGIDWTQEHPVHSPPARYAAVAATLHGVVVLFGGRTKIDGPILNDTWTWNGTDWTEQKPATSPPPRAQAMAATLGDAMVVFGGCANHPDNTCDELGDTWIWDGTTWREAHPPQSPSPRADGILAANGSGMWLYGGDAPTPDALRDTWSFDGATWTELDPAMPPGDARTAAFQCE